MADGLALLITSGGALAGVVLLERERDQAITLIILFGGMALFMALHLHGWQRFTRGLRASSPRPLNLSNGSVLAPARGRVLSSFGALCAYGASLNYFGRGFPLGFRLLTGLLCGLGLVGLVLALLRIIPPGRLRFEAHALYVRRWRYTLEVPWHAIRAIGVHELYGNRLVGLQLTNLNAVTPWPPSASKAAHSALLQNIAFSGAPIMFASQLYDVDVHALVDELQRRAHAAAHSTSGN